MEFNSSNWFYVQRELYIEKRVSRFYVQPYKNTPNEISTKMIFNFLYKCIIIIKKQIENILSKILQNKVDRMINTVNVMPIIELSKECRKEMQYYKVLAKEVEKRISILRPYVDSDAESEEVLELTDLEKSVELSQNEVVSGFDINIEKITAVTTDSAYNTLFKTESLDAPAISICSNIKSNVKVKSVSPITNPPKLIIDLSLNINETGKNLLENIRNSPPDELVTAPLELPEHDCDYEKKPKQKELDIETIGGCTRRKEVSNKFDSYERKIDADPISDPLSALSMLKHDGPPSLSSKSFTGSLNDLHTDSLKESRSKLIRQRSYTLLEPSPQLLAHLEVQSIKNGVDMISISMSESRSKLNFPNKKRRSWDLESAKVKWSSMAMQLSQTKDKTNGVSHKANTKNCEQNNVKPAVIRASSPLRSRSVAPEQRRNSLISRATKADPIVKQKNVPNPLKLSPSNKTIVKEPASPKRTKPINRKNPISPKQNSPPIPEPEDPATKVRELYDKIQQQQLSQMQNLMEKQKKEQLLLKQSFETQNTLLFKQLKTICPKSPVEAKEAWGDKIDRGPVSLSQLIDQKSPSNTTSSSPVPSTIADSTSRDDTSYKSKDFIKNNIKRTAQKVQRNKLQTPSVGTSDGSRTRTHSPNNKHVPRKLNYESSASERDFDNILTDRTNDTMADLLNVSFPSDSEDIRSIINDTVVNKTPTKRKTLQLTSPILKSTDSAIRNLENSIQLSMNTMSAMSNTPHAAKSSPFRPPTAKERAAATTIVAYAKGYLLRRLMRTERVQTTVQTIRDALLCALQLHQDRDGIRGADVDLHRRLIQQITAACYTLHETCVSSGPGARCALIAADRARRRDLAARLASHTTPRTLRHTDLMSKSHSGVFPTRVKRVSPSAIMSQSYYETSSVRRWSRASRARR